MPIEIGKKWAFGVFYFVKFSQKNGKQNQANIMN